MVGFPRFVVVVDSEAHGGRCPGRCPLRAPCASLELRFALRSVQPPSLRTVSQNSSGLAVLFLFSFGHRKAFREDVGCS